MNTRQTSRPEPDDDPYLAELLSTLKALEPPLEARIANRRVVAAELSLFPAADRQRDLPWWRRSIALPVPLAASLLVLMALAVPASVRGWREPQRVRVPSPEQPTTGAEQVRGNDPALASPSLATRPAFKHYETATYVCGIGPVDSEAYFLAER